MKKMLNKANLYWLLFCVGGYALLMGLMSAGIIDAVNQTVIQTIIVNIILAISLNLIIGITGQFSLGHAGFMCVGAFASAFFTQCMTEAIPFVPLRFALAIIVAALFAANS